MSLALKRSLKNKICWWAYLNLCCVWMFIACMPFITNFTIKTLFWEAEIFFKMCSQNAGNAISETPILTISWEHAPRHPSWLMPSVLGSHLRRSHTTQRGGQGENGPLGSLISPTTEESLKNALPDWTIRLTRLQGVYQNFVFWLQFKVALASKFLFS
jgi:hypothetical protein